MTSAEYRSLKTKRASKYKNRPTILNGVRFDSAAEARRWTELQRLESLGTIHRLRRQVPFELAKSVRLEGEKRAKPAIRYVADFVYFTDTTTIVEDVKSPATAKTAAFRLKRHLLKSIYGHDVRIVK